MDKLLYDSGLTKRRHGEITWTDSVARTSDPVMLFDYASLRTLAAIGVSPDSRRGLP